MLSGDFDPPIAQMSFADTAPARAMPSLVAALCLAHERPL
jgi:hypothetical protein